MSANTIPTAPRAMLSESSSSSATYTSPLEQVFGTASRELYPRLALLEALEQYKSDQERRQPSGDDVVEARRNFLDSFAYLCDVQRGGATVTAVGLQKLIYGNFLWLAANEGVRNDVKNHGEEMLLFLKSVSPDTEKSTEDKIFHLAVEKCHSRISAYYDQVRKYARNCRMQLRDEARTDAVSLLRRKLRRLSQPPPSMTIGEHIDYCYEMRGHVVSEIKTLSKAPKDDFVELAHYIGRLGATRSAAHHVVKGMMRVPSLRQVSNDIRTVEAPGILEVRTDGESLSPYEIVRGICEHPSSQNPLENQLALHNLVDRDLPSDANNVRMRLNSRKTIITRVHAELQIADTFSRKHYIFVDDDKYIGCSKPACYFCFNWLRYHKHGYVSPAAHYKVITGCRGPDNDINESGAAVLKEMYAKICAAVGHDILASLLEPVPGHAQNKAQYQSTEGSSYAPSMIATVLFK